MEFELLGWPESGPRLSLDHERFSYAGKFVMSNTGKAVLLDDGAGPAAVALTDDPREDDSDAVLAAVSFNEDRTDPETLWLRYVTVRDDYRGDGLGPRLLRHVVDRATERGYERVRIAVNNPFAYEAAWKAGFGYTGDRTGIAELIMAHPRSAALARHDADERIEQYRDGLRAFRERDSLSEAERSFLAERLDAEPPDAVATADE